VAAHIVQQLLERGVRVRGRVRSLAAADMLAPLRGLPGATARLELVEADLTRTGSFDEPAAGCAAIVHTASPYVLTVADPQRDLVDPAVRGTLTVLDAAARSRSVARVVLTSSMAAVTDEPDPRRVLTEDDWNTMSSLTRNPYYYSKTLAERAAWRFMDETTPAFDLVAINPFMVIGPAQTSSLNFSNQVFVDLVKGRYPGILALTWGMVDVRDVADAHVRALTTSAARGRYLCAAATVSMRQMVELLRSNGFDRTALPSRSLDHPWVTAAVKLTLFTQPSGAASYLRTHLGRVPRFDTTKIRTELGVAFRPIERSILETMADLVRWGHLPAPGRAQKTE
jgi:dihydroflavonol-4-reductase